MDVFSSIRWSEEYLLLVSLGLGSGECKSSVPDRESYYAVKEVEHMEARLRGRVVEVLPLLMSLSFPCISCDFQDVPTPNSGHHS